MFEDQGSPTAILGVDVQVGSSFSQACVIEAVPRPVAADQNNANREAHSACSVVEWPDQFRGFRA